MFKPLLAALALLFTASGAAAFSDAEVRAMQAEACGLSAGQRIAFFAEKFVGAPYDPDPQGEYVTKKAIVADERVDCMYHVFRSVELALSGSPEEAARAALSMRFKGKGETAPDGTVVNYEDRFQYAMDMIRSGRWGTDITAGLGPPLRLPGSRGLSHVDILPKEAVGGALGQLRSGDIVFFAKHPERRVVGEVIGHLGILKVEGGTVYLIHASGSKGKGGEVKKLPLPEYAARMPFAGVIVTRFQD